MSDNRPRTVAFLLGITPEGKARLDFADDPVTSIDLNLTQLTHLLDGLIQLKLELEKGVPMILPAGHRG